MQNSYCVYILANKRRGVFYVGVTNNLPRRIAEHKARFVPGFSKQYNLTKLVYAETHKSILEARARERALKHWRRAWKITLIEEANPDWRDLYQDYAV